MCLNIYEVCVEGLLTGNDAKNGASVGPLHASGKLTHQSIWYNIESRSIFTISEDGGNLLFHKKCFLKTWRYASKSVKNIFTQQTFRQNPE